MDSPWLCSLAGVTAVSLIPLVGLAALSVDPDRLEAAVGHLVSFAVGALLGSALLHLLPEGADRLDSGIAAGAYFLIGFVGFFTLEKFMWAHTHRVARRGEATLKPLAVLNLLGDGVHNLLDGMVIAAAFTTDPAVGVAATLAVVLHEVPQEIGDFGVLIHSGLSLRRAILLNALSGATAILGALVTLLIGARAGGFTVALLPVAAGSFVYIAAADLIPELHRARGLGTGVSQVGLILLGVALMALAGLLESS